jgi:hypothetical protein
VPRPLKSSNRAARCALPLLLAALSPLRTLAAQGAEPIKDNSFLIEEAYNQERGVIQHIGTLARDVRGTGWASSLTDEWPVGSILHQLSVTVPLQHAARGATGFGDALINYRYQLRGAERGPLYVSPRLSLVLPTGDERRALGTGALGVQVNLPVSVEIGQHLATHWNAGATWTPNARDAAGDRATTTSLALGQSVVWLVHPRFNALVETLWTRTQSVAAGSTTASEDALVIVPGVRGAINFASGLQIVPGIGVPIGVGPSSEQRALFVYLSFEHGF